MSVVYFLSFQTESHEDGFWNGEPLYTEAPVSSDTWITVDLTWWHIGGCLRSWSMSVKMVIFPWSYGSAMSLPLDNFIRFLTSLLSERFHFTQPCSWQRCPVPIPNYTNTHFKHCRRSDALLMLPKYHQEGTKNVIMLYPHLPLERLKLTLLLCDSLSMGVP